LRLLVLVLPLPVVLLPLVLPLPVVLLPLVLVLPRPQGTIH
jgi:hypothetical protein